MVSSNPSADITHKTRELHVFLKRFGRLHLVVDVVIRISSVGLLCYVLYALQKLYGSRPSDKLVIMKRNLVICELALAAFQVLCFMVLPPWKSLKRYGHIWFRWFLLILSAVMLAIFIYICNTIDDLAARNDKDSDTPLAKKLLKALLYTEIPMLFLAALHLVLEHCHFYLTNSAAKAEVAAPTSEIKVDDQDHERLEESTPVAQAGSQS